MPFGVRRGIRWCMMLGLTVLAAFDGMGWLLGPPSFAGSETYAVLRLQVFGLQDTVGMRPLGLLLCALSFSMATLMVVTRESHSLVDALESPYRSAVRLVLASGVGLYLVITIGILASWAVYGISAWGAPGKPAFVAFCYWLCATRGDFTTPVRR